MFDMGFLEMLLIGIVALVVIGPERLPAVARTVGQWIGKAQRFVRGVKRDLANEFDSGELRDLIGDQRKQINELRKMVQSGQRDLQKRSREIIDDAKHTLGEMEEVLDEEEGTAGSRANAAATAGADRDNAKRLTADDTPDDSPAARASSTDATDATTPSSEQIASPFPTPASPEPVTLDAGGSSGEGDGPSRDDTDAGASRSTGTDR